MSRDTKNCPICAKWEYISLVEVCPICGAPGGLMEVNELALRVIEEYRDRYEDLRVFGSCITN